MAILSIVVGLCSGLAAVILKTLVHVIGRWLLTIQISSWIDANILMLALPMVGITLTVLFVKYILKGSIGHGIPAVLLSISRKGGKLPVSGTYSSIIASTLTVAFGGSVGLEAPIVSTGSAIGSTIGRLCHLSPKQLKLTLGCGAAGAIAGIFKAPLAGILFVVEVLMFDLSKTTAIPLLLSAISASTIAYFLMGTDVQFAFQVVEAFNLTQIPYYIVLGVVCALASVYFLRTTDKVESYFSNRSKGWQRILYGGLLLGLLIFLFPPLFGEGYGELSQLLAGSTQSLFDRSIFAPYRQNEWAVIIMLVMLILLKVVATATTIGSGGVGGTFGPSLIVGGLCGYAFALLVNQLGLPTQSTANFALVGMAGVMAGVMHAPLMATFLIAELTGGYALMAPLLITVVVTFMCVNPFEQHSIYARKLATKGDLLTHDKDQSAWQLMDMHKLIETNFVIVRQGDYLRDLVEAIKNSRRNLFPVLDNDDRFIGVIHMDDVRHIIFTPERYDNVYVEDLMHPLSEGDIVRTSDSLTDVVNKFRVGERYNLIVIDNQNNYIGVISRANTFSAYRRFISETSDE
ncbi:MAG: chloride channel protein [Bacteroidales bacterium]|nr:chloride channel protein [Candidatus Colimorpha onthohippi]